MNTNRTAIVGGTAALLLVLTGCAGVEGQFDDGARAESAQQRVSASQSKLSPDQVAQAIEAYERLREVKEAEFRSQAAERAAADVTRNERIREVRQSESTPVLSVQERIRQAKQAESRPLTSYAQAEVQELVRQSKQSESEPAPQGPTPMTPEQVREFKASQVQ